MPRLTRPSAAGDVLFIVDAQPSRISSSMTRSAAQFCAVLTALLRGAALHEIPVVATAGRAGAHAPPMIDGVDPATVLWRSTLDPLADADVRSAIERTGRQSVVIAGLATDIGVTAAALSALALDYHVTVAVDGCSATSRLAETAAVATMTASGAHCSSTGFVIAAWLHDFAGPHARETMALLGIAAG